MNKRELKSRCQEVIGWMKEDYLREDGVPMSRLDGNTGKPIVYGHILEDLGDYLPFFDYFGESEFTDNQISLLSGHLKGNLISTEKRLRVFSSIKTFAHTDLLLGLVDHHHFTRDKGTLELATSIVDALISRNYRNGFFVMESFVPFGSMPIAESKDNTTIELLVELYKLSGEEKYLGICREMAASWRKLPFFKRHGLFPTYHVTSLGPLMRLSPKTAARCRQVRTMKHNTNSLFSYLELYKATGDETLSQDILNWVEAFKSVMLAKYDTPPSIVSLDGDTVSVKSKPSLTSAFPVVDAFCDCAHFMDDSEPFLETARGIADFWVSRQSPDTGLFPADADSKVSNLDSETDMLIALMKLHELTGEKSYRESAVSALEGIMQHHRLKKGYCLSVGLKDGKPADTVVKVKFTTLFMKALILFLEGTDIYGNERLYNLLKDR